MSTNPVLKNQWGSVKPYTRHTASCIERLAKLREQLTELEARPECDEQKCNGRKALSDAEKNPDGCSCPKWLYVRQGSKRTRYTLDTPSWAEALERAADKLSELNPEIAEARRAKAKQERDRKTVYEAINLWLDRTRSMFGEDAQIVKQYRSTFGWVDKDGVKHGGLLRFAAHKRIEFVDEFTPLVCQEWLDGPYFPARRPSSKRICWGTVRSFFNFLVERKVLDENPVAVIKRPASDDSFAHQPYSDAQYKLILKALDSDEGRSVKYACDSENYTERLRAFIELLRWTGADVIDVVQFQADQIEDVRIDGSIVPVFRYRRTKTIRKGSVEAAIPLAPEVAERLRNVPSSTRCVPNMPFRFAGTEVKTDVHTWSRRVMKVVHAAGIKSLALMRKDGRPALDKHGAPVTKAADCKAFRHTFAVGELVRGVPEEVVARMLGHVDTDMIRKHYAPWCKQRDEAHIRAVMESRKG